MSDAPESRPHTSRTLSILGVAALAFALAQTTLIPALPDLARALHKDAAGVTWTLTAYLVSAAVCTPLVGRLGDIYGKRRLLVITLVAFAAGSVLAAVSAHLWIVVAGRVVQGIGGGIFPLCFAIVRDEFPHDRVSRGVGLISAVAGIGGGLGLVLGAYSSTTCPTTGSSGLVRGWGSEPPWRRSCSSRNLRSAPLRASTCSARSSSQSDSSSP
jgi:MFS family permease